MTYTQKYYALAIPTSVPLSILMVNSTLPIIGTFVVGALAASGLIVAGYFLGKREQK